MSIAAATALVVGGVKAGTAAIGAAGLLSWKGAKYAAQGTYYGIKTITTIHRWRKKKEK